jgi:hypothetical protein
MGSSHGGGGDGGEDLLKCIGRLPSDGNAFEERIGTQRTDILN